MRDDIFLAKKVVHGVCTHGAQRRRRGVVARAARIQSPKVETYLETLARGLTKKFTS